MTARDWMNLNPAHHVEMQALLGQELFNQVLADMDEFAETKQAKLADWSTNTLAHFYQALSDLCMACEFYMDDNAMHDRKKAGGAYAKAKEILRKIDEKEPLDPFPA
jgi:hypothetical protein